MLFINFIAPPVGLVFLTLQGYWVWGGGPKSLSLMLVFVGLFLAFMPLWFYLNLRYRYSATRLTENDCVLEFLDEHIVTERPGFSKGTVEWAGIQKYSVGKNIVLVYLGPNVFFAIPKRAIPRDGESALIALLQRKMAKK
jgi:hypothetical protein